MKHPGSCQCGAVRYQVEMDVTRGNRCNCTICTKLGTINGIVKPAAFELLQGESELSSYGREGGIARRRFCKHCGTQVYGSGHLEEVGGDFVSVNMNTLDDVDPSTLELTYWDGRHDNWHAGPRPEPWPIFSP